MSVGRLLGVSGRGRGKVEDLYDRLTVGNKKVFVGATLRTRGGWDAVVVQVSELRDGFYAIHESDAGQTSAPIWHWPDGSAHAVFSVYEPPAYCGHPADILLDDDSNEGEE